jgi:hypothetical protein
VFEGLKKDLEVGTYPLQVPNHYMFYWETIVSGGKHMKDRSKQEKELLKLWERLVIFNSLTSTNPNKENSFLTIFPNDSISIDTTNCGTRKSKKWRKSLSLKELELGIEIPNKVVDSNKSINSLNF